MAALEGNFVVTECPHIISASLFTLSAAIQKLHGYGG
jgi:hypothetical protein